MNRIKELRQKRGWRQSDLALKLNTVQQTVGHWETETRGLDEVNIRRLCDIFGCTADYLLCRSEMPTPQISAEDWALLEAYHAADEDTRAGINLILSRWVAKKGSPAAI